MKTLLLSGKDIETAAKLLKSGKLVAVPTETVYGLAANAMDENAVAEIFAVKGRPQDNPLILHISDKHQIYELAEQVPEMALKLMDAFWPGALTLIFNAKACVPRIVTAQLSTVAVRYPNHPVMLGIIRAADVPLAAPSANRSGLPSPTLASHVIDDLDGKIAAVVDGGACEIGVESTVIDVTGETPCILRLGGVSRRSIERVLGISLKAERHGGDKPRSPGQKYRHYAPHTPLTVIEDGETLQKDIEGKVVLCPEERAQMFANAVVYGRLSEPETLARGLFAALRAADKMGAEGIVAICPVGEEFAAVRDRLYRASLR